MKKIRLFLLLNLFLLPTAFYAQNTSARFETIRLSGIGTISIPSIMELQAGEYKAQSNQFAGEFMNRMGYEVSGNTIIYQQKGLNAFERTATYARVMIETTPGRAGEYKKLDAKIEATRAELDLLGNRVKLLMEKQFEPAGVKILRWDGFSIAGINGQNALKVSYLRQLKDNPPVNVELYTIDNYDRQYRLTFSYRETDSAIWKEALEAAKNSFKITNVR